MLLHCRHLRKNCRCIVASYFVLSSTTWPSPDIGDVLVQPHCSYTCRTATTPQDGGQHMTHNIGTGVHGSFPKCYQITQLLVILLLQQYAAVFAVQQSVPKILGQDTYTQPWSRACTVQYSGCSLLTQHGPSPDLKYGPTGDMMTISVLWLLLWTPRTPSLPNMKGRMYIAWPGWDGSQARSTRNNSMMHCCNSCKCNTCANVLGNVNYRTTALASQVLLQTVLCNTICRSLSMHTPTSLHCASSRGWTTTTTVAKLCP